MPSIVTHYLYSEDILKKLPTTIQKKIQPQKNLYHIFSQSFDNLFYYSFFFTFKGKNIRKLGDIAQKAKTFEFFSNILTTIKNNNLTNNSEILCFLYGSLNHYILDMTTHPYIIYYSGLSNVNKKYLGGHEQMEVMLDAIIYHKKTNQHLKNAKLANTLLPKEKFSKSLKEVIKITYKKTFNINNIGTIYEKSCYTGNFILKYFVTDHTGIKKKIYQFIDKFPSKRKYQYLNFHITKLNNEYLNLSHNTWHFPNHKELTHQESFYELYAKAITKSLKIASLCEKYFENKCSLEQVLKEIGNNSYVTGLNWHDNAPIIYFRY